MKDFDYELLARRYAGFFILLQNTKISTTSLRELKFIHGNDFKEVFLKCYPIIEKNIRRKRFLFKQRKRLEKQNNLYLHKNS